MRKGQDCTRLWNFYTMIINEQELFTRWKIELVSMSMIKPHDRVKEEAELISNRIALKIS